MKVLANILLLFLLLGCATNQGVQRTEDGDMAARKQKNHNKVKVDAAESSIDLTSYLRRIPGIQITGSGERATVQVRSNASAGAEYRPLYVVNGTPLGNSYSSLFSAVDPNEIKSVEVLKTPSETSRYGTQGSGGVILIELRDSE
ncbi:hypothetical protein CEQ90_03420 [Lewinellaceae bacterium SD302]|nr:hypothetical protein CEQ90_03420 [Lewinellaceae bacterium SD302]